jgi:hypothetical protein
MDSSSNLAVSFGEHVEPARLSDAELLLATRRLVGRSNQLLAALLAHLAELEARGIHRTRACSSLYVYCIYELRFSEDEAYRRVAAARLVRRFPALLAAIATGELHLTGLLLLGPLLNESNLVEVLARAKHRTKKEITSLVRSLDPLPDVPSRIEPLGPAPARLVPSAPTWAKFVQSTCPVRELEPGERPRDWIADRAEDAVSSAGEGNAAANGAPSPSPHLLEPERSSPALERAAKERYSVQFTATEEYVELVDRARALLSHAAPRLTLDELHLRALRALVAELERQKYAVPSRPDRPEGREFEGQARAPEPSAGRQDEAERAPAEREPPRRRGRYVPAAVRRSVFLRDEGRCTFADHSGRRCSETHRLELHHLIAFARGGESTERNLTLRCQAHNALAAEDDFGRAFVEAARGSPSHDAWPK